MVKVKPCAKVITIERAQNVLTIERVVELFSAACGQICALKEVDELFRTGFEQICAMKEVDRFVLSSLTKSLRRLKRRSRWRSRRGFLRLFFPITAASSRGSGRNGAVNPASTLILSFLLTRRTSARLSGASRTSAKSSSVTFRKFSVCSFIFVFTNVYCT